MQSVDVGWSLDVLRRAFLIGVGPIVVSGCVDMAQEASNQELFLCREFELLSLLFLSEY